MWASHTVGVSTLWGSVQGHHATLCDRKSCCNRILRSTKNCYAKYGQQLFSTKVLTMTTKKISLPCGRRSSIKHQEKCPNSEWLYSRPSHGEKQWNTFSVSLFNIWQILIWDFWNLRFSGVGGTEKISKFCSHSANIWWVPSLCQGQSWSLGSMQACAWPSSAPLGVRDDADKH